MFDRVELKENAKKALKHYYWMALLACLLFTIFNGDFMDMWRGFRSSVFELTSGNEDFNVTLNAAKRVTGTFGINLLEHPVAFFTSLFGSLFVLVKSLIFLAFTIFIVNVMEVGLTSYFLKNRYKETKMDEILAPFQQNYMNVVKVRFFQNFYIFLWSLLLFIPGIIKSYEYYFVEYLLAENPDLSVDRALEKSRMLTDGEKWNIFVFELSFLGWFLLASLLGGVGRIFIYPYRYAATAELYMCLKERKMTSKNT